MAPLVPASFTIFAALASVVRADVFLAARPEMDAHSLSTAFLEEVFSLEISSATSEKTRALKEELRPLFSSLPKNELGNLEHATVRYALHRYFTKKHGWSVRGLRSEEAVSNTSLLSSVPKEDVPSYTQNLFENRAHGQGLSLEEFALFTATLSDVIFTEARLDIEHIFQNRGLDLSSTISGQDISDVLDRFLLAYISGYHEENYNFKSQLKDVEESFFAWRDIKMFADDHHRAFGMKLQSRKPFTAGITFEDVVEVAEDFVHNFRTFQSVECSVWKNKLVEMEQEGTGRVRLSKFYSGRHSPSWTFVESVEYLRALGALDESIPGAPSVIIPNYVAGASNCLSPSDFYNVCCRDECEDLLAEVERAVGEPSGTPGHIAMIVSNLESDTVEAPRNLSSSQISRLQDIAEQHSGRVPLHGRLFAQWMHHNYPRECPFPHLTGTARHIHQDDFKGEVEASAAEMRAHSAAEMSAHSAPERQMVKDGVVADKELLMPWLVEEELVASHKFFSKKKERTYGSMLRAVCFVLAAVSLLVPAGRAFTSSRVFGSSNKGFDGRKLEQHLV